MLDKIWFWIQDHAKGFDKGYYEGYDDGHQDGLLTNHSENIRALQAKSPDKFSDQSFKLGYLHAIAVLKGEVK